MVDKNDWYETMLYRWNSQHRINDFVTLGQKDNYKIGVYNHLNFDGRQTFYILNNQNIPIASTTGDMNDNAFQIVLTIVNPENRRQGLASWLYDTILHIHKKIVSDIDISEDAKKMWNNMKQKNPDKITQKDNRFQMFL